MQQLTTGGVSLEAEEEAKSHDEYDVFEAYSSQNAAFWSDFGDGFTGFRPGVRAGEGHGGAGVQDDLRRAADFTATKQRERDRYREVQRKLSEFDRDLSRGHFDKGKLDGAIDELKDVMKDNTLESHDRDALTADLSNLRTLKDVR